MALLGEKELLSKWKAALDVYSKIDSELQSYCGERGLIVSRCDQCSFPVLVEPEESSGSEGAGTKSTSVLRWHFCSDNCRQKYWSENKQ